MTDDLDIPGDDLGPAMSALTPRQRIFVRCMLDTPTLDATAAARRAGYQIGSSDAVRVQAFRLMHSERVIAAYHEEASKRLRSGAVLGASVLMKIAQDPMHKDQLKAAMTLLNRIGLHEKTEHKHVVERPTDDIEVKRQIVALAKELGVDPRVFLGKNAELPALAAPIDAEFEVIESSTEGLEDVI